MATNKKKFLSNSSNMNIFILACIHTQLIFAPPTTFTRSENNVYLYDKVKTTYIIGSILAIGIGTFFIKEHRNEMTKLQKEVKRLQEHHNDIEKLNEQLKTKHDSLAKKEDIDISIRKAFIATGLFLSKTIKNSNFDKNKEKSQNNTEEILIPQWVNLIMLKDQTNQIILLTRDIQSIKSNYATKKETSDIVFGIKHLKDHFTANYVTVKNLQDHLKILHDNFTTKEALALAIDTIKKNMH